MNESTNKTGDIIDSSMNDSHIFPNPQAFAVGKP